MNDSDFDRLADETLERVSRALDASGIDCDWELKAGGVLEIEFEDGSRMIVNRHSVAQQIWVAARSGDITSGSTARAGSTRATAPSCSRAFRAA